MNDDQVRGNWKQFIGNVREKWGHLTDNEILESEGKQDYLVGKIQERYGKTKDMAMEEVNSFLKTLNNKGNK
jgi:uncharacterized protein YjbJ (UPF0337 family)